MNYITLNFVECDPLPVNGWNVQYRIAGSSDPYTDAGNFFASPAIFADDNAPGTQYEGIIRSDCCGSGDTDCMGNDIPWTTVEESSGGTPPATCFLYRFQVFGSDGESVHVTGTYCNGDPYEYNDLVGAGAPAPVCLQEGTVDTHSSFVIVVDDTQSCPSTCRSYQVQATPEVSIEWEGCSDAAVQSTTITASGVQTICAITGSLSITGGSGTITDMGDC